MILEQVKEYYGTSYNFEKETDMSHTNFVTWAMRGYIPYASQRRLERLTKGKLKASQDDTRPS